MGDLIGWTLAQTCQVYEVGSVVAEGAQFSQAAAGLDAVMEQLDVISTPHPLSYHTKSTRTWIFEKEY